MSLKTLKTLCAIAQQGSFAAAGDKLGLTQAAVSIQVRQLEEQLGTKLFDRIGRNQVLNHDGRKVLQRAEQIVALYAQLGDGLGDAGQFSGELLLGAVFSIQTGPLGPVLARLRDRYPQLKIKVLRGMSIDLAQRLESGELDAVLITEPQQRVPPEYEWSTLEKEPFYVVAHHEIAPQSDVELLSSQPFIRLDPRAWAGSMIDSELRRRNIIPDEVMELDSLQAALMMVEQKLGVTVMALGRDQAEYLQQRFCLVPFGEPVIHRNIGLYQRRNHSRKRLVGALLDEFAGDNSIVKK
ncbi:LysR family transcriptional regulator [Amphritea balenae]|uniref:LysR family transcriptional regulator n=1 Tax=Amphritea balenae TaxID=452629 RepID=A0A3P1SWS1_9GAMM|nr:LysR family transcriptional regulator [Amphritea balenae]RRD01580.1 LysR family transcriptional regulator [Amphritea balenae]GGK55770.1 LysR family transcriptional regulator [Amphritea balenae]